MNIKLLRLSSIAFVVGTGVSSVAGAQTVLELRSPASTQPCVFQTAAEAGGNDEGVSADPQTGRLKAFGNFGTGCAQGASAPVIMPGPANWTLPEPWTVGQPVTVQWSGNYANTCTYGGTSATGWPSGSIACPSANFPSCTALNTSTIVPTSSGFHQFSLVCSNSVGSTPPSTSSARTVQSVSVTLPEFQSGPATWNLQLPWTVGTNRSVSWQVSNASVCEIEQSSLLLPAGVTLNSLFNGGDQGCSTTQSCANNHPVTLSGAVAGNYSVTLRCTSPSGGVRTSARTWAIDPPSGESCPTIGSFNRIPTADVYFANVSNTIGNVDVRTYEGIYGRDYGQPSAPITKKWPGVSGILAAADFGNNQYLALKFDTNGLPTGAGSFLTLDATTWGLTGGGLSGSPIARISMTISKKCGDFDRASPDIPLGCFKSNLGGNQSFGAYVNGTVQGVCSLAQNQTYYLNMIYAPLTTPATAVYNGRGPYVVQIRNFTD